MIRMKLCLVGALLLCFCFGCKDEETDDLNPIADVESLLPGTILYLPPPDNCNDFIIDINNSHFKPEKLAPEFKVHRLKVLLKYETTNLRHNCGFAGNIPVISVVNIAKK